MSEDYTYQPLETVTIRREELAQLFDIKAKVQQGYELYCANATYCDVQPKTFEQWLDMLSGKPAQP